MNDTINKSSRYYDNCTFRSIFNKHAYMFSISYSQCQHQSFSHKIDELMFILYDLDHLF